MNFILLLLILQCVAKSSTKAPGPSGLGKVMEDVSVRPDLNQMIPFRPSTTHGQYVADPTNTNLFLVLTVLQVLA